MPRRFILTACAIAIVTALVSYQFYLWRRSHAYDKTIAHCAARHGIDPALVKALIWKESSFRASCRGGKGEYGLMQLRPAVARDWLHARSRSTPLPDHFLLEPELNIEIGTWYLAKALHRWEDRPDQEVLALAQYNAGPENAKRWANQSAAGPLQRLDLITFPTTRSYVSAILNKRKDYLP